MTHLVGGCLCETVRYDGEAKVLATVVCCCTYCQKQTSSAFSTNLILEKDALSVSGSLNVHDKAGDSGQLLHSHFCASCGCTIYNTLDVAPDLMVLKVGSLDDPSWVRPSRQIYCDSAQPWLSLQGDLERFAKMPED